MDNDQRRRRGRPKRSDDEHLQLQLATMHFAQLLIERSGLLPVQIEASLGIQSTPPGNRWRAHLRGERMLSVEQRGDFAQHAIALGWLNPDECAVDRVTNADEADPASHSKRLATMKRDLEWHQSRRRRVEAAMAECAEAIRKLEHTLAGEEDYWSVLHQDYAEQTTFDHECPEGWQLVPGHQWDFQADLAKIRGKVEQISVRDDTYEV
ncbi:MAG: hypothetical protein JO142_01965 [Burkholderiales bacterium]|nr:hypothetical protein [Burkholderiales bacterium]